LTVTVGLLELGRWNVAERLVEAFVVVPGDPFERRKLDVLDSLQGAGFLQGLRQNDSLPAPERLAVTREIVQLGFPPESHLRKFAEESRNDSQEAVNHLIEGVMFWLPRYGSLAASRTPLEKKQDEAFTKWRRWERFYLGLVIICGTV
jgi:hypothetical protein